MKTYKTYKTYKNKKLNIIIENPRFFEILEQGGHVELKVGSQILYRIFPNSTTHAYNSSTIHAFDSSTVEAFGSSTLQVHDSSTAYAFDSSTISAFDSSTIHTFDSSTVEAYNSSTIHAHKSSTAKANDSSTVYAFDSSTVYARNSSTVEAFGSSTIHARNSSTISAFGSSTIHACGFSCVFIKYISAVIKPKNHYGAVIKQVFKTRKTTIGYEKLRNNLIAELEIPKGQVFQSANHGECWTASVKVLSITSIDKKQTFTDGASLHYPSFTYVVGETVNAEYSEAVEECAPGIHFFLSREEAVNY